MAGPAAVGLLDARHADAAAVGDLPQAVAAADAVFLAVPGVPAVAAALGGEHGVRAAVVRPPGDGVPYVSRRIVGNVDVGDLDARQLAGADRAQARAGVWRSGALRESSTPDGRW